MASLATHVPILNSRSSTDPSSFFAAQRASWRSPDDILTILMLIGGDIVQCAIAQLAGSGPGYFVPVAFSFGWLSYAMMALKAALGTGRLMPEPEVSGRLVNVKSGNSRDNRAWILGRLLRDEERACTKEREKEIEKKKREIEGRKRRGEEVKDEAKVEQRGLTVVFYDVCSVGTPARDWVYKLGVGTIVTQQGIAVIPGALHGDWLVLIITVGGTILSLVGSGLKQWRDEKYAGRRVDDKKREVSILTRGNGSGFAMVLVSRGPAGLRLEDLAGAQERSSWGTAVVTGALAVLWLVLLLTVEGVEGQDGWYMLAVGGLGMFQNVLAAGARRSPAALGFPVKKREKEDKIADEKVIKALERAEKKEAGVGIVLLKIFFPGGLRDEEKPVWDELERTREERSEAAQQWKAAPRQQPADSASREGTLKGEEGLVKDVQVVSDMV